MSGEINAFAALGASVLVAIFLSWRESVRRRRADRILQMRRNIERLERDLGYEPSVSSEMHPRFSIPRPGEVIELSPGQRVEWIRPPALPRPLRPGDPVLIRYSIDGHPCDGHPECPVCTADHVPADRERYPSP